VPFNDWEAQVIYELHLDDFYINQHQEKISNNFKFAHFSLSHRIQVGNVASSNSLMQGQILGNSESHHIALGENFQKL
jgi:hypothetical protein